MFSYTGITEPQVNRLREEHGVYLIRSGRMCMSGLSRANVQHVADVIAHVLA
jgi:aromatic-amino-acid transaminase